MVFDDEAYWVYTISVSVSVSVSWTASIRPKASMLVDSWLTNPFINKTENMDCIKKYALDVLLEAFFQACLNWLFYI